MVLLIEPAIDVPENAEVSRLYCINPWIYRDNKHCITAVPV